MALPLEQYGKRIRVGRVLEGDGPGLTSLKQTGAMIGAPQDIPVEGVPGERG